MMVQLLVNRLKYLSQVGKVHNPAGLIEILVEYFNEPAHVGPLDLLPEVHPHGDFGDGMLPGLALEE